MILDAIDALMRDGNVPSNERAIAGYVKGKYGADLPSEHLFRMARDGEVFLRGHNYVRANREPKAASDAGAAAATAPLGFGLGSSPSLDGVSDLMIQEAIRALGSECRSCNSTAVMGYIKGKYGIQIHEPAEFHVRVHMQHMRAFMRRPGVS